MYSSFLTHLKKILHIFKNIILRVKTFSCSNFLEFLEFWGFLWKFITFKIFWILSFAKVFANLSVLFPSIGKNYKFCNTCFRVMNHFFKKKILNFLYTFNILVYFNYSTIWIYNLLNSISQKFNTWN